MAINFITANSGSINVANGDETTILPGINLTTTADGVTVNGNSAFTKAINYGNIFAGADAFVVTGSSSGVHLVNDGIVHAINGTAFNLKGTNADITIFNQGTVTSYAYLCDTYWLNGSSNVTLVNSGDMRSLGRFSIIDANIMNNVTVQNSGLLAGGTLAMNGTGYSTLHNTGTIETTQINAVSTLASTVFNSGLITGWQGASTTLQTSNVNDTVVNTGTLNGTFASKDGEDTLTNSGTIAGVVSTGNGNDVVINTGWLRSDLDLGADNDTFDGRGGRVDGTVSGKAGDDTYIIDDEMLVLSELAAQGTDEVRALVSWQLGSNFEVLTLLGSADLVGIGSTGADTITGNMGDNVLDGRAGADVINGSVGNDVLMGRADNDTLSGDEGNDSLDGNMGNDSLMGGDDDDFLRGGAGNDTLRGDDGDDRLLGGLNADSLSGGAGDDTLIGGLGLDILVGGGGEDVFVFNLVSHSPVSPFDRINDFTVGDDRISFAGLVPGQLEINLLGSFTGGGTASIRSAEAGGTTNIYVDADGDGTADMRIQLSGTTGLTEAEFIL